MSNIFFLRLGAIFGIILMPPLAVEAASYPAIIRSERAVAYYRLEELPGATIAMDSSASALHGAVATNSIGYPHFGTPGIQTNATVFSIGPSATEDSFITIPWSPVVAPTNPDGVTGAPFTVECWVKPATDSPAVYLTPLSMCGPVTGSPYNFGSGWDFSEAPSSPPSWQLAMRTEDGVANLVAQAAVVTNKWTHLAATWDGTNAIFYVNGAIQQTAVLTNYVADPGSSGAIGAGPNTGHRGFEGAIDEVAFYTNALLLPSISNHFAIGTQRIRPAAAALSTSSTNSPAPTAAP